MTTTNSKPTDEDYAQAKQVAEWMGQLCESEQTSDYLYNLSIYGKAGIVTSKGAGIVASALQAFKRANEAEAARVSRTIVSIHVGSPGERLTLKVRLCAIYESFGNFGVTYIHKFEVAEGPNAGAQLTWFGSSKLSTIEDDQRKHEPNDIFWIKGTVKNHDEYKEVKQTVVTRVTTVMDPVAEKARKAAAAKAKRAAKVAEATKAS